MSITSDIRSYADTAVAEGRKFVDSTLSTAQAQLNDVSGQAGDIVDKAGDAARELRANAEKVVNIDALKAAIEPYVEQARSYQASVQDRAEAIFAELKKDPRFAKAIEVADSTFDVVVETVQERVVKPVQSLTGLGVQSKPAASTTTTAPSPTKAARKPAATKPATKPAATSSAPAAKKTPARKAPVKRAPKA